MRSIVYRIILALFIIFSFFSFYRANTGILFLEYLKIESYKQLHPEFIPEASTIRIGGAWHDTVIADMYWLKTIQYIADNLFTSWKDKEAYNRYFSVLLNTITDLHPRFTEPYVIWLLFAPAIMPNDSDEIKNEKKELLKSSIQLGEKWVKETCNPLKIQSILSESELSNIWKNPKNQDPCMNGLIPYYLWYSYYWNNDYDAINAVKYYKIAAGHTREWIATEVPIATQYYIPLILGKWGNYITSAILFLSMWLDGVDDDKKLCSTESEKLLTFLQPYREKPIDLASMEMIKKSIENVLPSASSMKAYKSANPFTMTCNEHYNRAIRQFNLALVTEADNLYLKKYGKHAQTAMELIDSQILPSLPTEYEQQEGIIYEYREDKKVWDYTAGTYKKKK